MLTKEFITECRHQLLSIKEQLLNQFRSNQADFHTRETGGDEVDQSMSLLAENQLFASQQRIRHQLLEVEMALARIEKGSFGICEETLEPIELERLQAIPWTRLSIEGAEIREAQKIRFVR